MRLFSTTQLIAADQHSEFLMMDPDASQKGQVEAIFSGHNTHKSVSRPCHLEAGCHRGTVITIEKEARACAAAKPERFQWSKGALAHFLDLTGVCDVEHGSVGGIASKVPAECSVLGHDSVGIALSNSTWLQFIPIVKGHNSEPCK